MRFEKFCSLVADYLAAAGCSGVFGIDDNGKYIVRSSDGKTFTGNSFSKKITVRWGDGHQSMIDVAG